MGGPAPTELRLEFRDLTTNMGLRNGFSNTLRWSPMPGAALSTTLLDPLQRPSASNKYAPMVPYSVIYHPGGKRVLSLISVSATVYNHCFLSVLTDRKSTTAEGP